MTAPHVTHIQADVRVPRQAGKRATWDLYRAFWLPDEGWACTCDAKRRCAHLRAAQDSIRAALAVVSEEGK